MKKVYNYKQVFDSPIRMREFGKYSLPIPLYLNRTLLFFLFLGILWIFFRGPIAKLNEIAGGTRLVIYFGVPIYLSGVVTKWNPDGQKLFPYLRDVLIYLVFIKIPRKSFWKEEVVVDKEPMKFKEVK